MPAMTPPPMLSSLPVGMGMRGTGLRKVRISQSRSAAILRSARSGLTAMGWPTVSSDDRADAEFFGDGFDEDGGGCGDNDHVVAGGEVVGD